MGVVVVSTLLRVEGVSISYDRGRVELFQNVSFTVGPGEVAVIVGDSGSGKTTLLHLIAGFIRPHARPKTMSEFLWRGVFPVPREASIEGKVFIKDEDVTRLPPPQRDIGLVMQRVNLYPNMTVLENLTAPLRARGTSKVDAEKIAEAYVTQLQIDFPLHNRPNQLSGGQSQRVAIGKLLARDPLLALCDEAFSNLDWKLRQTFRRDVIHELTKRDKSCVRCGVLFVSHDLEDAREADKIIYLQRPDHVARAGQPTKVTVFEGGRGAAWDAFRMQTEYRVVQLVSLGAEK